MIILENVTKRYRGSVNALRSISATVDGESVAVLGDRGAGKSSLAAVLCGITAPSAGKATLDGVALTSRSTSESIGYMPEKSALSPALTLMEALTFAARLRGLDRGAVDKALSEAEIQNELANVPVGMLGNAATKRASLAFALLGSPQYLVLDQPILGLSETEEAEMLTLLRELGENYVLIYFSDTVDDARALCDRVMLLSNGKSVAYDSFDAVISPSFAVLEYKIRARGDVDKLKKALSELETVTKYQISVTASGTSIIDLTMRASDDAEGVLRALLAEAEQKVIELKKSDSPVEKVLSRLYDIQDAREEERRLRREETAAPVKVTEALVAQALSESSDGDGAEENLEEIAVNPRDNSEKSSEGSDLIKLLSKRDTEDDSESVEQGSDGESTLF